jgi:hypothetical protein
MPSRYVALLSAATLALLIAATPANAHELTVKKAKKALKPVAAELVPTVGPAIAQKLPGATITKSSVSDCVIKKSHRAECALVYTIQGASTGETSCGLDALVKFKSARSKQLTIAIGNVLVCFFPVPLQ